MNKVIGMDLGDKQNVIVVIEADGNECPPQRVANTSKMIQRFFAKHSGADVVIEAGTHSAWISRLLESMGHKVCVGNPRKLRAIWDADDKSDERDASILALMYRMEPRLLHSIQHRGEDAQATLAVIKGRDQLVGTRTKLSNHVRGTLKTLGITLKGCSPLSMPDNAPDQIPTKFWPSVSTVLDTIRHLNEQIKELDKSIEHICKVDYPETEHLRQVPGIGPITALTFVLTLEDPARFKGSRSVGAFLGLTPKRDQSGDTEKQLHITKAGNGLLRRLLVTAAQYILGPFAQESALRDYGERISARGGKRSKRCAVVALARKLAVLLHRLWMDKSVYKPYPNGAPA